LPGILVFLFLLNKLYNGIADAHFRQQATFFHMNKFLLYDKGQSGSRRLYSIYSGKMPERIP